MSPIKYKPHQREIIIPIGPSIAYVELTQGKYTKISASKVEMVASRSWVAMQLAKGKFYAGRVSQDPREPKNSTYLHRFLMNDPAGKEIDHINGDTLDNRDENLRVATRAQNMHNRIASKSSRSGIKGVMQTSSGNWRASFMANGENIKLGLFATKEEAHIAMQRGRAAHHGEFARCA